MHLQKKKNKSGSTSVQIRQRVAAGSKLVKTIGCSCDALVIEQLIIKGKHEITRLIGQHPINFDALKEKELVDVFFNRIEGVSLIGPELVLGKLFDEIGFNAITEDLFRHLVITRLVYPVSKLKQRIIFLNTKVL